ncbi:hypothetical protein [Candidatus Palauibacter sp.]|uniref:hypothetical protein n=1 Tax=Candidatus Palauibacter sp. TaxID=3101350 RepID=UPI003C6F9A5D
MNRIVAIALAAGLTAGCGELFRPGDEEVMAALVMAGSGWPYDTSAVTTPDTVNVNELFPVTVQTYHTCLLEEGRTRIDVDGLHATITPYKRYFGPGSCPDFLAAPIRTVDLHFAAPGIARVTVVGLDGIRYPYEQRENPANVIHVSRKVVVR